MSNPLYEATHAYEAAKSAFELAEGRLVSAKILDECHAELVTGPARKWPKKLKLKAIDEAMKVAKKRPAVGVFAASEDGKDPAKTAAFCAVGCLGLVMGDPVRILGGQIHGLRENPTLLASERSFSGKGGEDNLCIVVSKNDNGGAVNSTLAALRWLRKQIEKE